MPTLSLSAEHCLSEVTGKSRLKGTFDWPLTTIGNSTGISCPYGPDDAQAQRMCVGNFSSGASWSDPDDSSCNFKSKRTQAFDKLSKVLRNGVEIWRFFHPHSCFKFSYFYFYLDVK